MEANVLKLKGDDYNIETFNELEHLGFHRITETVWKNDETGEKFNFLLGTYFDESDKYCVDKYKRYIRSIEFIEPGEVISKVEGERYVEKEELLASIYLVKKSYHYEKRRTYANPMFDINQTPSKCLAALNRILNTGGNLKSIADDYGITKIEFKNIPQPFKFGTKPREENPFCVWKKLTKGRDGHYYGKPYTSKNGDKYVMMPIRLCVGDFILAFLSELDRLNNEIKE